VWTLDASPDVDLQLELDELQDFACSDPRHERGESYHTPDTAAEFMLLNPCCGDRAIVCRSRAYYLKYQAATIRCARCQTEWAPHRYRFIPLPGVMPL